MSDNHAVGAFAKRFQCPCCNNPWNQSASNDETPQYQYALACGNCSSDNKGYSGLNPDNIDTTVSPKDNFYKWSNGNWIKSNPIPAEYPSWNTFLALRDTNMDRLKMILDELMQGSETLANLITKDEYQKLSDFYTSFMNDAMIEALGIAPLQEIFEVIQDPNISITHKIARLHKSFGINVLFRVYSSPDKKNSNHTIGALSQSGLGLPDRDYYFDVDKAEIRDKYLVYIEGVLQRLAEHGLSIYSTSVDDRKKIASEILALETVIAGSHLTRTQTRDPELTYNKMSIEALSQLAEAEAPSFLWLDYFAAIQAENIGEINVATLDAIKKVNEVVTSPYLRDYLIYHTMLTYSTHLSSLFVQDHFDFFEKQLKGTKEMRPRWKRGLSLLEDTLGEILGKLYVSKYFPVEAKVNVLAIVQDIKQVLYERLLEINWMSDATREEALKKLNRINIKIGYPDKWIDYSSINIEKDQHVKNIFSCDEFLFNLEISRMNKATDRDRWYMTPQTVNAYYHPSLNDIVFPSAILQAPFYDATADRAVQYGSLGAVVGHELTHGFDDQGRKYDYEGNMRDWWSEGDGAEYERRAEVMINQAETFQVYGVNLKGKLTCGENIADLGGVKLGLRALKKHLSSLPQGSYPLINGFTPEQRLFLAWSQTWRENCKLTRLCYDMMLMSLRW
jgi:putative endopeptidase